MTERQKIAIIQSHPIQHFCPQFTSYSKLPGIELTVLFETDKGLKTYYDENFKKEVNWSGIDLSGFQHQFLNGSSLHDALQSLDPDIVLVYGYFQPIQKQAFKYAVKNHKKILYISDSETHQKRNPIKEYIKRLRLKQFFKHVDYCLSVGDSNEDVYRGYGIENSRILRMFFPININYFDQLLIEKQKINKIVRARHTISTDTLIISTIGKLVPWKRQIDIIHVLRELESRKIKAMAFIIGSGIDEDKLRHENDMNKSNKAVITGFVQPEEMARFLCATDIYIHPAEIEPHSLAISEAIYCGCSAIISNRCGSYGPTDDIQPGRNGMVYPVGDIVALANKIEYLHENPSILKEFSNASTVISQNNQKLAHGEALMAALKLINSR